MVDIFCLINVKSLEETFNFHHYRMRNVHWSLNSPLPATSDSLQLSSRITSSRETSEPDPSLLFCTLSFFRRVNALFLFLFVSSWLSDAWLLDVQSGWWREVRV